MYRIMILDDEPNIVDSLYTLLSDRFGDDAEINAFYYPEDALNLIRFQPIDIFILDIRMPAMNGLEILEWVDNHRPFCRVILLTGYSDFQYIQRAMRCRCCVGYVLKTQTDEVLLEEIQRQTNNISDQTEALLQSESIRHLRNDTSVHDRLLWLSLTGLSPLKSKGISCINPDKPLWPVLARFENGQCFQADNAIQYIDSLIKSVFYDMPLCDHLVLEDKNVLWLFQTVDEKPFIDEKYMITALQYISEKTENINVDYLALKGEGNANLLPLFLHVVRTCPFVGGSVRMLPLSSDTVETCMERLRTCLTGNDPDAIKLLFGSSDFETLWHQNEVRSRFLAVILNYTLNNERQDEQAQKLVRLITDMLSDAVDDLAKLESMLIPFLSVRETVDAGERLVRYVLDYIDRHLGEPTLSLTDLSIATTYNPVYLSRVVKQRLGKGVLETINERRYEKARSLLEEGKASIQDITKEVGFQSPSYFAFFFRKRSGMSPSAYLHLKKTESTIDT